MPNQQFDVLGLGNAIVDVIAPVDDDFLAKAQLRKGAMQLVDEEQALALYDAMGATMIVSGGSAANTIAGLASFGAKGAFVGKVRADEAGHAFAHDIKARRRAFFHGAGFGWTCDRAVPRLGDARWAKNDEYVSRRVSKPDDRRY